MTQPGADQQQAPNQQQGPGVGTAVAVAALALGAPDPFLPLRWAALAALVRAERRLYDRYGAVLDDWLDRVRQRVVTGHGTIDPHAVWAMRPTFANAIEKAVEVEIREIYAEGWSSIMLHTPVPETHVDRYLQRAFNRLVGVPDSVYHLIRAEVGKATAQGWSIDELAAKVEGVLSAGEQSVWPGRGLVVARTEAIGAYNAGQLAGFKGHAASAGGPWEKAWLATHDERTRPTHYAADVGTPVSGQRVPLGEPFRVGGALLDHPGAQGPRALPEEVIQCRCSMLLLRPGEAPDLSDRHGKGAT